MIVGAGAGGGVVAKELADGRTQRRPAGARQVVHGRRLPQGRSAQPAHLAARQRLRARRRAQSARRRGPQRAASASCCPARAATATTPPASAAAPSATARMAWRFLEKDFRMRSTYGVPEGSTLETGPSPTPISSRTTRRRSRRSASPATSRPTRSKGRAASRCPCRRCRRIASTRS